MNEARYRVSVEVCYSSTLGECWLLRKDQGANGTTTEISSCPAPSATDFQNERVATARPWWGRLRTFTLDFAGGRRRA